MNKKAIIFMPLFAFFVLIVLSQAFFNLFIKGVNDQYSSLGLNQAEIIKAYNKGIEHELNAEIAVKYSIDIAVKNFTKYSGVKLNCNNVWKFNSNCEPDLENNFIKSFNEALIYYNFKAKEIRLENNSIVVLLEDFNYNKKLKNFEVEYSVPIKIKQEIGLDMGKLNEIKAKIEKCIQDGKGLNTCAGEKNEVQGNIIQFTIENNKNIKIYEGDKLETKKMNFTFKINNDDTGIKRPF